MNCSEQNEIIKESLPLQELADKLVRELWCSKDMAQARSCNGSKFLGNAATSEPHLSSRTFLPTPIGYKRPTRYAGMRSENGG